MIKLLFCLLSCLVIASLVLQLRQQRLDLGRANVKLHDQIASRKTKLWNQQLQIATYTAPNAIAKTITRPDLQLIPARPPVIPVPPTYATTSEPNEN